MTVDERLEKLAERTGAIAQSVEPIASLHLDSGRPCAELAANNEERMAQLMEAMSRLPH